MLQAELIKSLGGNKTVAELTGAKTGAVAMWRARNTIPWKYRHVIARHAAEMGVPLPDDFWLQAAA